MNMAMYVTYLVLVIVHLQIYIIYPFLFSLRYSMNLTTHKVIPNQSYKIGCMYKTSSRKSGHIHSFSTSPISSTVLLPPFSLQEDTATINLSGYILILFTPKVFCINGVSFTVLNITGCSTGPTN